MSASRRQFLKYGGLALGGAALGDNLLLASPMNQPIGFQTAEIVPHLKEDWKGTWQKMASYGYKFADMITFRGPELSRYTAKDTLQVLTDVGLTTTNGHFSYAAWTEQYDATVAWAHTMGFKSCVCSATQRRKTIEDWKWTASQLNEIGAKTKKDGLQLAYHNHEIEFRPIDGIRPWDVLMENTDPDLVKAQLDVGNLTFGGGDAVATLTKYKDRTFSLHCKDFVQGKASVPVGQGVLDWNKILGIAKSAGIKSYVTEVGAYGVATLDGIPLEQSPLDVLESFRQSFVFLKNFKD